MAEKIMLGCDRLREVLEQFPEQCREGFKLSEEVTASADIDKIFVLGMGGSALGGEILRCFLLESARPFFIVKDYHIPKYLNEKSLVFAVSYSGNPEETISSYKMAVKKTSNIIVMASGGKLVQLAKENKTQIIRLPTGLEPRYSYGLQFFAMLGVLRNSGLVQIMESDIEHTFKALKPERFREIAAGIADRLVGKIPLIYTSERLRAVGYKWKININESGKVHAFSNVFPEFNHNEIQGFTKLNGEYHVVIIKDDEEIGSIRKRMKVAKELIKHYGTDVSELVVRGENMLTKIISAISIGDWVAYHVAVKTGTNPWPAEIVDKFKEAMQK